MQYYFFIYVTDYQGTGKTTMTYLLPEGWTVNDSLYWQNTDAIVPVRYAATYTSANEGLKIEIYPDLRLIYNRDPMGEHGVPPPGSIINGLKKINHFHLARNGYWLCG